MILAHVEVVRSIRTAAEGINKEFLSMIEAEQLKYKLNSFQEPLEDLSGSCVRSKKRELIN